ncbi:MAG: DNA polymerase III subunit beta [Verrucomicrobia bacterium]|nr:MAG: DNA polymerase III subunit beta [Verrucomicrobiota bacterium]TAE86838.1 MAG: DNA polymerase III subunit beta [Verrucomicrobiota bacterium]TAF24611.1 MAG: DNA polymerase III subunit beta [Verrucomicrobiota bacterium]TAF40511.1 MAG: DNA polymerase III subunit beta [Verrucomicrobiota bacterium]
MKFSISKEALLDGLQKVQHVVSTRTTLPILSNVLLVAKNGRLSFTTTDLDVGITGSVEAKIDREGATTLPAKRLVNIVRELPASEVEISVDAKNVASIQSGPSFFKIIGLGQDDFPPLPDFEGAKEFRMPQAVLRDGLKKTSYAISTDETRYVLNGIYTSFREGKLTLVATDGRRLAMVENDLDFPVSHECDVIVPTKAVQELMRLLGDAGEVLIRLSDSQISFAIGDHLLISKLIEGNYPNYRQVIPGDSSERVELPREAMFETVRRVSLLSSDKSNSVKLVFGANTVEVTANSPDVGEARETMEVAYSGAPMQIAFNPEFLMAPMRNLESDTIYLDLIDEMSPGVVRIDGSFLYVIMPMRVTG